MEIATISDQGLIFYPDLSLDVLRITSRPMVRFPPAKINLGLNIVRKRDDGYHDIESVLVPIPLYDILEAVVADDLSAVTVDFTRSGIAYPGEPQKDLCIRAVEGLRQHRDLPALRLHLHKVIPTGAGLGGGSSDGTYTLMLLNDLLSLGLDNELPSLAASLGSDAAFFLHRKPQLARGRGDDLTPIHLDLHGKWLMIVNPGIHVPTAEVYAAMKPSGVSVDLQRLLQQPMEIWQDLVRNDMEEYVLGKHPPVAAVKKRLLQAGAVYCAMSGSGSTIFAFFDSPPADLGWPEDHRSWKFQLINS